MLDRQEQAPPFARPPQAARRLTRSRPLACFAHAFCRNQLRLNAQEMAYVIPAEGQWRSAVGGVAGAVAAYGGPMLIWMVFVPLKAP